MPAWFENDQFWMDVAPAIFPEGRIKESTGEVDRICKLMELAPDQRVLDLGCGVGRHSIEFARKGHHVTGVDRTAGYLQKAANRAQEERVEVEWVHADMRDFRREGAFDAVVSILTSYGYFEHAQDDARVLANVAASLRPGGVFLMDIMSKEVLARIYRARDWQQLDDDLLLLEERKLAEDWSKLDARWILLSGSSRREHSFQLTLYSAAELKQSFTAAGLEFVEAFGSLDGAPYDENAERLLMMARKG